jgi:hypothetical protein
MIKFELLPNEIVLECFVYLNGIDIYNAFNGLNNRFNDLIRNISLHANFNQVKKEIFDQFCTTMLLYTPIRNQIVSLYLSDAKGTCGQVKAFLSMFQLNEFYHLRSLTLFNIVSINVEEIKSIFESLSNLHHLVIRKCYFSEDIQSLIMRPTLKMLSVPTLYYDSMFRDKIIPITHLTITESCDLETLYEFFRGITFLKYLKIESLSAVNYYKFNHLDYLNDQAVCLTQLIIHNKCWYQCDLYELIFKQTPNLKTLTFSVIYNELELFSPVENRITIFDADCWENIITLLIPQLNIFKFVFEIRFYDLDKEKILDQFQRFQTEFWHKQHHWYTLCELSEKSALIYTIPYCLTNYRLESDIKIDCNVPINKSQLYHNITQLNFAVKRVNTKMHHYFVNIKWIKLKLKFGYGLLPATFDDQLLKLLQMSVNLTNLQILEINHLVDIKSPLILLNILQQTPNLSLIILTSKCLISSLTNDELCKYFNMIIKKLIIFDRDGLSSIDSNQLIQFCKTFSNLEQLQCSIQHSNDFIFILEHLSKLSHITIKYSKNLHLTIEDINHNLQKLDSKLNKKFLYEFDSDGDSKNENTRLNIWINYNK